MATAAAPSAPEAPTGPRTLTLNGSTYRPNAESMTIAQQVFVIGRLRRAGIATSRKIDLADDNAADQVTRDFENAIWAAFESGEMYEILGGLLLEDGATWSRQRALETAALIEHGITDPGESAAVFDYAADIVVDFFKLAAGWNATSPRSTPEVLSDPSRGAPDNASNSDESARPTRSSDSAATPSTTTGPGTPSSGSLPHGT